MSIRAYRIEEKEIDGRVWTSRVETPSFNASHNFDLFNFLANGDCCTNRTTGDGSGEIEVNVEVLRAAVDDIDNLVEDKEDVPMIKQALLEDIKMADENGLDFISYDCF